LKTLLAVAIRFDRSHLINSNASSRTEQARYSEAEKPVEEFQLRWFFSDWHEGIWHGELSLKPVNFIHQPDVAVLYVFPLTINLFSESQYFMVTFYEQL
jgi:hypothetical protein